MTNNDGFLPSTSKRSRPRTTKRHRTTHVRSRSLVTAVVLGMFLATIVAVGPSVATTEDSVSDLPYAPIPVIGGELTPAQLDEGSLTPLQEIPAPIAELMGPGDRFVRGTVPITHAECETLYNRCEAITVLLEREAYVIEENGKRFDVHDRAIDLERFLGPGISAVGSSPTPWRWQYDDTEAYIAVVGSDWVQVGTYRTTQKVTLHGRQSTWRMTSDVWTGPGINMTHKWNCVDDNGRLPNTSCSGGWQSDPRGYFTSSKFSSQDQNYHQDNDDYWYNWRRSFTASGWIGWTWFTGNQSTHRFQCSGSTCQF